MPEIVSRRMVEQQSHEHLDLLGYRSSHLRFEAIMLDVERTLARMALGERFWITVNGSEIDLKPGKCSVCGHEPYLRTAADSDTVETLLEAVPEG